MKLSFKNFNITFLLVCLLIVLYLFMFKSIFSKNKKWESDYILSNDNSKIKVKLYKNLINEKNIGIIIPSDECIQYEYIPMNAPSIIINDIKVQFLAQCISKGYRMSFAKTDEGRKYIINEFKTKQFVVYKQGNQLIIFSAIGFIDAYNNFEFSMNGL